MWVAESRRAPENRVYDSASELAFVAQRLRMELTRPEAVTVLAPVLGCLHEAAGSVAAALRDLASDDGAELGRALERCADSIDAAALNCERARRAAAVRGAVGSR